MSFHNQDAVVIDKIYSQENWTIRFNMFPIIILSLWKNSE